MEENPSREIIHLRQELFSVQMKVTVDENLVLSVYLIDDFACTQVPCLATTDTAESTML